MVRTSLAWARRLFGGGPTLANVWDDLGGVYRDRTFLNLDRSVGYQVCDEIHLSYAAMAQLVAIMAGGLRELGVCPGDRVALCGANRVDYPAAFFAIVRLGAIAVPLHHKLKSAEVAERIAQCGARFFVTDQDAGDEVAGAQRITLGSGGSLDDAMAAAAPAPAATIDADATVAILYTSGTTGTPKGAELTSNSLLSVARIFRWLPDPFDEVGVYTLPTAHIMGLATVLSCAFAGAALHWRANFDADAVLDLCEMAKPTFFVGVPAMYGMMLRAGAAQRDLSSIKFWVSGADAMPSEWVEQYRGFGCSLRGPGGRRLMSSAFAELYGMVELSGPAILKLTPATIVPGATTLHEARSRLRAATTKLLARLGGRSAVAPEAQAYALPIPPYQARVVDADGKAQPFGTVGELWIRGPGVTKGYDQNIEATREATRDGWLRTGDLAKRGRLGDITFIGRQKDVIKHGGYSVFPAEVEAEMLRHPGLQEAVVFAAPHPTKGEVPVAVVVLAPDSDLDSAAVLAWCREQIAGYRAPRAIGIVQVADIPRNDNAKVMKAQLRNTWLPTLRREFPTAFDD